MNNEQKRELSIDGPMGAVKPVIRRDFEADKGHIVRWLSDQTGLPFSLMEKRLWTHGGIIADLIEKGEIKLAREVALDPESAKEKQPELFDNTRASRVNQQAVIETPTLE